MLLTPWQQIDITFSVLMGELNAARSWTPEVIGDWNSSLLTMRLSGQLPGLLSGLKFSVCLSKLAQSSVSGLIQTLLGIEAGIEMAVCVDALPEIDEWFH